MRLIEPKVVKTLSIAEQIMESPVETIVVVKYNEGRFSDALVKTGSDGYKHARSHSMGYLNNSDIERWVNSFSGASFYFV